MKNNIETAATLLRERAKRTTDATAFRVAVYKDEKRNEILLTPDMERRTWDWTINASTFYHSEAVADICTALHLSFYISGRMIDCPTGKAVPSFEVRIYETL